MQSLFFILFELGFQVKYNLIGEISASELFLLFSSFYYLAKINPFKNPLLKKLTIVFVLLILVQIITEDIIDNSRNNALKGIFINIVAYLHICFLYYYFQRDRGLVKWFALGIALRYLLFTPDFVSEMDEFEDEERTLTVLAKFQLIPMFQGIIAFFAVYFRNKLYSLLVIFIGVVFVVIGARSGGAIFVVAGIFSLIPKKRVIMKKHSILYIVFALFTIYGTYSLYVNQVLKGNIDTGNNSQLLRVENPYNPINILMFGRADAFIGLEAMLDKPWTGWGAWTKDPDNYYYYLKMELNNKDYRITHKEHLMPSHSVLIGSGVNNGVVAFVFMFIVFLIVAGKGIRLLKYHDQYYLIIALYTMCFIWDMLFSPQSHFRMTLPMQIAFILVSWEIIQKRKNFHPFYK